MTDQETKELLAKGKELFKQAASDINIMKVQLSKYSGDKSEPQKRIETLENLLNYAIASESRKTDYEDTIGQLIMNVGELNGRLKECTKLLAIAESIGEFSITETIELISQKVVNEINKK
jgi:uncharacterized protein YeeX (DUF496 family)